MEKKEEVKDRALRHIFRQGRETYPSDELNKRIMQRVYKIQKRKEIRNICVVSFTSLALMAGVFCMLRYYYSFHVKDFIPSLFGKSGSIVFPDLSFVLLPICILCILLWLDYRFRKRLHRSE